MGQDTSDLLLKNKILYFYVAMKKIISGLSPTELRYFLDTLRVKRQGSIFLYSGELKAACPLFSEFLLNVIYHAIKEIVHFKLITNQVDTKHPSYLKKN